MYRLQYCIYFSSVCQTLRRVIFVFKKAIVKISTTRKLREKLNRITL